LALCSSGRLDRCGGRTQRRLLHGCDPRRRQGLRTIPCETQGVKECQGGESNSRPRAYESPALPLSYPGYLRFYRVFDALPSPTNPECFRGCSTAELPWRGWQAFAPHGNCQRVILLANTPPNPSSVRVLL